MILVSGVLDVLVPVIWFLDEGRKMTSTSANYQ
jgi:hypothetical protein